MSKRVIKHHKMSVEKSPRKTTPYSDISNCSEESSILDVSVKKYEVCREIFELILNESETADDNDEVDEMVTSKGLRSLLSTMGFGMTEAEIGSLFENFGDARWSIVEFIKAVSKKDHPIPNQDEDRQELWETFRFFDKDGDGFISLFDLQDTFCHLGLKVKAGDVYQMIHQADKNGDCRIDINEFENMIQEEETM